MQPGSRPPESPLAMPAQVLEARGIKSLTHGPSSHIWRKLLLVTVSILVTIWLGWLMFRVLNVLGMTALEWGMLAIFIVNVGWISFAFVSAVCGFLDALFARPPPKGEVDPSQLTSRTVILFPVYNESVRDVFATVESISNALGKLAPGSFECFILSDSNQPDVALEEEAGFDVLRERSSEACPIFYRRRTINLARKAGNVHDFVTRWGGRYDHMLIYDADSYMSAETLVAMTARMEADSELGLLQTIPKLIGGQSLFARTQQFAASVYGPVLGRGIAWWSQNEGNYWGHNAMIRVQAFAEAAGLPEIPGRAPFGGHILSHDFVEAALMRRAGWKVRIDPDIGGSFEEGPQTIIDLTIRDRRWCQGNLQHSAVLVRARGMALTSRIHFSMGIFSYLASPLWLVLILVGMGLSLQSRFLRPAYFSDNPSLTPTWPVIDAALALNVFFATLAVLLLPKAFGVIVSLIRPPEKTIMARLRLLGGAFVETLISALTAPVLMAAQTSSVLSILTGRDVGWSPQSRGSEGYAIGDVARRHALTTVLGVVLTLAALAISPVFAAWLAPATLGMMLAVPLSYYLGKYQPDTAVLARSLKTAEQANVPDCFSEALEDRLHFSKLNVANEVDLLASEDRLQHHADLVDPHWPLDGFEVHTPLALATAKIGKAQSVDAYLKALTRPERMALVNSPETLAEVSRKLKVMEPGR